MTKVGRSPTKPPLHFECVLKEERAWLLPDVEKERAPPCPEVEKDTRLAALCLSGGGTRSATFALGVLQALARFGLLKEFHYLSTVSGGGYIGAWLTAWRVRFKNDAELFRSLDRTRDPKGAEAPEIAGLRANSNYLTPKLGILSADTWAALALVVRNLLLNWCVFGPFFLAALLLPKLAAGLLDVDHIPAVKQYGLWLIVPAMVLAFAGLACAVCGRLRAGEGWLTDGGFMARVLAPLGLVAFALTVAADAAPAVTPWFLLLGAAAGAVCYAAAWLLGYVWWQGSARDWPAELARASVHRGADLACFVAAGGSTGLLLTIGFYLRALWCLPPAAVIVFGPAWVLASFAIADLAFVGLNSFAKRGDQDREWLARYGGWLLAVAASLLVVCAIDLYMPRSLNWGWAALPSYLSGLGVSGAVTLLLGPSKLTGATAALKANETVSISTLVSVAAMVFAACLAGGLSIVDDHLVCLLDRAVEAALPAQPCDPALHPGLGIGVLVLLAAATAVGSIFINVNRFSLHALYRNRLVRAYLGSARARDPVPRHPDPFSKFDLADNVPVSQTLQSSEGTGRCLLHVINMTLNTVSTDRLAWQERKAEPFSVTAFHAGNDIVGYQPTKDYGGPDGGISLGTAMAISGAAVSPNMGYHSSPLVGMLLSLFNVRLGWWLGNPGKAEFGKEGPVPSLIPALDELAGRTTDGNAWIYLSDGGHFENLGLYEMVKRECRIIVVSDAGCDPQCAFEDLGNAVRKIYIDLGVSIDFHPLDIAARKDPPMPGFYCAVGTITYPHSDRLGWLLYIKPGYQGTEPADIRSYAIANPAFPHETTVDQWFTESQFEAYRGLGAHITELICTGGDGVAAGQTAPQLDLEKLMKQAARYLVP